MVIIVFRASNNKDPKYLGELKRHLRAIPVFEYFRVRFFRNEHCYLFCVGNVTKGITL